MLQSAVFISTQTLRPPSWWSHSSCGGGLMCQFLTRAMTSCMKTGSTVSCIEYAISLKHFYIGLIMAPPTVSTPPLSPWNSAHSKSSCRLVPEILPRLSRRVAIDGNIESDRSWPIQDTVITRSRFSSTAATGIGPNPRFYSSLISVNRESPTTMTWNLS